MDGDGWRDMVIPRWGDPAVVRARLDAGAAADARLGSDWDWETPLHRAAEAGAPAVVAALAERVADVDVPDVQGRTPLWQAVAHGRGEAARVLLAAGADAWRPGVGEWTPGRLALTTDLAPLFARLPGAVPLTAAERAAQARADLLIAVFGEEEIHTEGLDVTFVGGLGEDEVIRRLGVDPAGSPVLAQHPGQHEFALYEAAGDRAVGVTGIGTGGGGCVITQPLGLMADERVICRISRGTTAYSVFFNPKGGTYGTLHRDGAEERHEEIGLPPYADDPPEHWLYRFWQQPGEAFPYDAHVLAYACAMGGIPEARDARALSRVPRRLAVVGG